MFRWRVIKPSLDAPRLVLVTDPRSGMSTRMVWRPGQSRDEAISEASLALRQALRDPIFRQWGERENWIG